MLKAFHIYGYNEPANYIIIVYTCLNVVMPKACWVRLSFLSCAPGCILVQISSERFWFNSIMKTPSTTLKYGQHSISIQ